MSKPTLNLDREAWLTEAAQLILDDKILPASSITPAHPFRVSVGFPPRSRASGGKVLAVCCKAHASADSHNEIFIAPHVSDSLEVLSALCHELVHYSDDCASGHRNHFATVARRIGLEGKLTATRAGSELKEYLQSIIDIIGQIPHGALNIDKAKPKQTTRMLKVLCPDTQCNFSYRTTQVNIIKITDLLCPACNVSDMRLPTTV